jgi:hypothetical protein
MSTHYWNFIDATCGSVLEENPSTKPHRLNFVFRLRNRLFGKSAPLADIPQSSVLTVTSADCPALGKDILKIIMSDRDGHSPILEKLGFHVGAMHEELSQSKEREEASRAAKEVSEWQRGEGAKTTVDREMEAIQKLKSMTQPEAGQYQRRGIM